MLATNVATVAVIAITLVLLFYSGLLFDPVVVRRQLEPAGLRDFGWLALGNYLLVPAAALGIVAACGFPPVLNLVLVTMAMLPCAALVPPFVSLVGERPERALFAFIGMSIVNIAAAPVLMALLALPWVVGFAITPHGGEIVALAKYVASVFVPMSLGVLLRVGAPGLCAVWQPRLRKALPILMGLVAGLFVYGYREPLLALGWQELQALLLFESACIGIGLVLSVGMPEQRIATVLICAFRNAAMGLAFTLVVYPHTDAPTYMLVFVMLSFLCAVIGVQVRPDRREP